MSKPDDVSCLTCPSYLNTLDSIKYFKTGTGVPMCARFTKPLARPGQAEETVRKAQRAIARGCADYGKPRPATSEYRPEVVLPDMDRRVVQSEASPSKQKVTNCGMCKNFISAVTVQEDFGWMSGLCSAKGMLVMQNQQQKQAKNCEFRTFGPVRTETIGLNLFPEFTDSFTLVVDPIKAFKEAKAKGSLDSQTYESDIPVAPADAQSGVRAWRKIVDPEGYGDDIFLPVFDREFFTPDEQRLIPQTGDEEHPELYVDHGGLVFQAGVAWTKLDETPALWGEAGVGKTELARHMAWLMGLPFRRITITRSSELDDLAGKAQYTPEKGTFYRYGRVPTAWRSKGVVILDEPNTGPPDVWQFLRPLTDNSKQLVLDQNEGEIIPRNEDCYLMLAMNPAWDPRNRGAEEIADADGSRLLHVWVTLPPREIEMAIIKQRVMLDGWEPDRDRLNFVMDVAEEIRKLSKAGDVPVTWGIRNQIKVMRLLRWFDAMRSYRLASANYLEPEAQDTLLDVVKAQMR